MSHTDFFLQNKVSRLKWCGPIDDPEEGTTHMITIYQPTPQVAIEIVTDLNGKYIQSDIVNMDPGTWPLPRGYENKRT